ncbi:DUF1090 domain-containing protein [Enterobacteriaceae bacterium ESL0689]|nr:DUF1090 domain-containing protein [Enterobacteriaceae bacterium ESL0689]
MKYHIALILILTSLSSSVFATSSCQEKEQNIQREIRYAKEHDNQKRIDGLNIALREMKAHCHHGALKAEHQQKMTKHQQEITKHQRKLNEAQQELKKSESYDD